MFSEASIRYNVYDGLTNDEIVHADEGIRMFLKSLLKILN